MYTPIAAETARREASRAAHHEPTPPQPPPRREPAPLRRLLAGLLRRSADRLAPGC
jgi:hypothetical protein